MRSSTRCLIISPCRSWDARRTQQISLPHMSSCSSPKAMRGRLIYGVAYSYNIDASKPSTKKNPFADEHGLPAQRFYNVLCMAYGADSKLFADLVDQKYLPSEIAEGCADENDQVIRARTKLIRPYLDQTRAKQVRAKQWLKFDVP